jgi:hypothetical protein
MSACFNAMPTPRRARRAICDATRIRASDAFNGFCVLFLCAQLTDVLPTPYDGAPAIDPANLFQGTALAHKSVGGGRRIWNGFCRHGGINVGEDNESDKFGASKVTQGA